jgi:replicative DNA helicase
VNAEINKHHDALGLIVLGDCLANRKHLDGFYAVCPAPAHRWYHDQRHRIFALAFDAVAIGQCEYDQGAILSYLSKIRWQDALDAIKGKPLVLRAGDDLSETALAGIQATSLLGDASCARLAGDGVTYGTPARAAGMLRHLATRRQQVAELEKLANSLQRVGLFDDALPAITGTLEAIRGHGNSPSERNLGECLTSALNEAESLAKRKSEGKGRPVTWGVKDLDQIVPLRPGRLVVLSARPGGGKTSLALQAAHATSCELGRRSVSFLSLEMDGEQLATILACRDAVIPVRTVLDHWETLTGPDKQELRACAALWSDQSSMMIRDSRSGAMTGESVAAWIRTAKNREHGSLELVVIDYLGLIKSSNPRQNLSERVADITRTLKQIALSEQVCIILLAQITREGRKPARGQDGKAQPDPEPRVEDLYGGSAIESDADAVLFLHPQAGQVDGWKPVNAILAKHRHGPMGAVQLAFFGEHQHFQSIQNQRSPIDHDARMWQAEGVF